jgi:uncharacterized protein (TIGR03084 family)
MVSMPVDMTTLADDVAAETTELRLMIAGLDESGWRQDTPAAGWTVADQVGHLAYFDDAAITSATDPDEFAAELERAVADDATSADAIVDRYRVLPPAELLVWFDESRARLLDVFRSLDPSVRLPWFGPPMSAASALTARLMETWAHGQDIADALGVVRQPTDRLKHVAHIGVGARAFSFAARGRSVPDAPVRVELAAPGGETWTWGPTDADDRVSGPALDFCLVVTQRRHLDDTALRIEGPAATEWMSIAQAFAGPPGPGRRPGQFA